MRAASKYFQEANHGEFIMVGADAETLKIIVDFCYTGRVNLTEENVDRISAIADRVEFDLLKDKCCQFYADNLNVANSVGTLVVADKHSFLDLRQRALGIICKTFECIPSTELQKICHRLLQELLKCDNINATEVMVFKRLLEWFGLFERDREQFMPDMLELIRLQHMTSQVHFAA